MKHIHEFRQGKSESVETCRCGKFRFTKKWLEEHPPITEVKQLNCYSTEEEIAKALGKKLFDNE